MIQASNEYENMMRKPIRNRGYISVAFGVVNQNAQSDANSYGDDTTATRKYYSHGDVFKELSDVATYGSLEQDFVKANGAFKFPPRNDQTAQFIDNGFVSNGNATDIVFSVTFNAVHDVKGLTLEFEPTAYPTVFSIITANGNVTQTYNFTNNSSKFETLTTFGEIDSFSVNVTTMVGGAQRLHIKKILMGIGVVFQNDTIENTELESFVSGISAEVSYKDFSMTALDVNKIFDIDNTDSLINYLEPLQPIAISIGVDLDDGSKEWIKIADLKLKEWNSQRGRVSFVASDLLAQDEKTYSHMVLTDQSVVRTPSMEFEAIFADMGLLPSDYHIDNYFATLHLQNPIEENTHRDCLQLLANAFRGIVYEDENGIIQVKKAFDSKFMPSNVEIETNFFDYKNGVYTTKQPANEYGKFADGSKNLYDPSSENNVLTIDYCYPDDGNIYVQDGLICYNGVPYEEKNYSAIRAKYVIGQWFDTNKHAPFSVAGQYVVTATTHFLTNNDYVTFDSATAYIKFGNTEVQGTVISHNSIKFNVTQEMFDALEDGETIYAPILFLTLIGVKTKGYNGSFGIQIVAGEEELPEEPYYYISYTPTISYYFRNNPQTISKYQITFTDKLPQLIRFQAGTENNPYEYAPTTRPNRNHFTMNYLNLQDIVEFHFYIDTGVPNEKISVSNFFFGDSESYSLIQQDIFELYKAKEAKVKEVKVKIYTYREENGEIVRVDDDVWYTETLGAEGVTKFCENPLISSSQQAELVAKWLANYYSKGKTYAIEHRGEPTLQSNDCIHLENNYDSMTMVTIEKNKLSFNGAFHGNIESRRAN